jgi:hypothetical protein
MPTMEQYENNAMQSAVHYLNFHNGGIMEQGSLSRKIVVHVGTAILVLFGISLLKKLKTRADARWA